MITYNNLEPVLLNVGTVDNMIFQLPVGPTPDAVVGDDLAVVPNRSELRGSTFENTAFTNPDESLTIRLGSNGDIVGVLDMDADFNPNTAFTIDGGSGSDIFNVQSTQRLGGAAYASGLTINGGDGNDIFNVSSDAPTNNGDLDDIASNLTVNGDGDTDSLFAPY